MKQIFKLILGLTVIATSNICFAKDKPSVHGMLVFGEKTVFFSHLPMFHSPHDYQAIFSVNFSSEAKELYLTDKKAHPEQSIYTFVPEVMVLSDGLLKAKTFKGDLYRGHFERGGEVIGKNIQVSVDQIVIFKKFDPKAVKSSQASYYFFGTDAEYWLAHDITKPPDFDHIAQVKVSDAAFAGISMPNNSASTDEENVSQVQAVTIEGLDNSKPLPDGKRFDINFKGQTLKLESLRATYLEFDDLSM